ncbi:hypothetical protein U3C50_004576 [Providencia rettgeri]|nr:hypothetical protein [Providencia rettgeri]EMB3084716.1 hypothetical protein [Providencia rettgeri]MDU7496151.1 hypothetical protein [Providencia rettgeri]HEM8307650.1 hypothetical protein [Providencia rettgeri]
MNSKLNVNKAEQILTNWKNKKERLIERLIKKSEQIKKFRKMPTSKREVTKLKNAIVSFAKTKAELDSHHWRINKRTDQRVLAVWKRIRNYLLDSLDNLDRTLCIELENQYQNHIHFLNHQ